MAKWSILWRGTFYYYHFFDNQLTDFNSESSFDADQYIFSLSLILFHIISNFWLLLLLLL